MNIKALKFLPLWAMALAIGFAGCNNDDDSPNVDEVLEDGFYLTGEATGYEKPDLSTKLIPAANEAADNAERSGMYDGYVYLEGNKNFNIAEYVVGSTATYGGKLSTVAGGADERPAEDYFAGDFTQNGAAFTVPTTGLYHVFIDKTLAKTVIVPVTYWSIIGNAVGGWNDNQKLEVKAGASKSKVEFEKTNVQILNGSYKFRHTGGWKVDLDTTPGAEVRAHTNFGGTNTGIEPTTLVPGGSDYSVAAADRGKYTVNFTWEPRKGFSAKFNKTGEADAPEYPETMYVVGASCKAGWDTKQGITMYPTPKAGQFWAIVYLTSGVDDGGFKLLPNKDNWDGAKGAPNGTAAGVGNFQIGGDNIPGPETSGYYMITLDMEKDSISITEPEVFGIGDAFGGWDGGVPFTVNNDNKTISGVATATGNLRSYAKHAWISDWWHAEINIVGNDVVYRGKGGDPAAYPLTAGQTVTYNIDDGTASVQ